MSLLEIIPGQSRTETFPLIAVRSPGNPATKFPLMVAAAEHIGIHRITLYRVPKGQFPDRGDYAARYRAFVAQHSKEAA